MIGYRELQDAIEAEESKIEGNEWIKEYTSRYPDDFTIEIRIDGKSYGVKHTSHDLRNKVLYFEAEEL